MKKFASTTLMALAAFSLAACQTTRPGEPAPPGTITDEGLGMVLGGAIGGVLGNQVGGGSGKTVATIAGTLLGAWAGKSIAQNMTRQDVVYHEQASTQAQTAPIGQAVTWYNPESQNQGSITPTREGQTNDGRYCREYQQTITVDGETQRAYGQACQQPDGSWEIVN